MRNSKGGMKYETAREDRKRRKEIRPKDYGQAIGGNPHTRRYRDFLAYAFRLGDKVAGLVARFSSKLYRRIRHGRNN